MESVPSSLPLTQQQLQTPPPNSVARRPWGMRIKNSFKARWPGYPLIIILAVTSYLVGEYAGGRPRFFTERDPDLSYPYLDDTIPAWSLLFLGGIGPIFFIFLTQALLRRSPRGIYFDKRTKDLHLSFIVLGETLVATYLITNILKGFVGRYRPDFFAYCDYKNYREAINTGNFDEYFAATTPNLPGQLSACKYAIKDAFYSFPSGHSSISFCGLTFLTLFLLHVTSRINFSHHSVGKILRFFIILVPMFSAALIAATRVIDYKHHVEDTIWGALIGIFGAIIAFQANYGYARPANSGAVINVTGGTMPVFGGEWNGNIVNYPPVQDYNKPNVPVETVVRIPPSV